MIDLMMTHGYLALLITGAFVTPLFPVITYWLLPALVILADYPPMGTAFMALAGFILGGFVLYGAGAFAGKRFARFSRRTPDERAARRASFAGAPMYILLLSFFPYVAEVMSVLSGVHQVPKLRFAVLLGIGRSVQVALLLGLVLSGRWLLRLLGIDL